MLDWITLAVYGLQMAEIEVFMLYPSFVEFPFEWLYVQEVVNRLWLTGSRWYTYVTGIDLWPK